VESFIDRIDAGRKLGDKLSHCQIASDAVVLGLARGGIVVAHEVAVALDAPLDVLIVRKIGVPSQPELAMGALGEDGELELDHSLVRSLGISPAQVDQVVARERVELQRRVDRYRGGRQALAIEGVTAIIVDDGVATGSTGRAACRVVRRRRPSRLIFATPVASADAARAFARIADEFVSLIEVEGGFSVGQWYERFDQTSDDEVIDYLKRTERRERRPSEAANDVPRSHRIVSQFEAKE